MSNPRLSPRSALVVIAIAVLAMTGCTTVQPSPDPPPGYEYPMDKDIRDRLENFCQTGNGSKSRPMICIDQDTLQPSPNEAWIWDVEADDNGNPSRRPVMVHWFTQKTADLAIRFTKKGCVGRVHCDGNGHCWTKLKKLDVDSNGKKKPRYDCKYEIEIDGKTLDPDLEINPCCWIYDRPMPQ